MSGYYAFVIVLLLLIDFKRVTIRIECLDTTEYTSLHMRPDDDDDVPVGGTRLES